MIKPVHYTIRIEPDFKRHTFKGAVQIATQTDQQVQEIILNAKNLTIYECMIKNGSKDMSIQSYTACRFKIDEAGEQVSIQFSKPTKGNINLIINYSGLINDNYAGLYRSKYRHNEQEKTMISTQFEASDARRAFPCFDQPDLKATFDIEFVINKELTGLSNTTVLDEKILTINKKLVRFKRTPKISTYLVFFGIGEFEFLEDASAQPLVRVVTSPGKTEYGRYALDMARKSLEFGEEYLGVSYPLSKCDYIAMPDSMGAMENFGAIRHAEDVLLVYPGSTSKSRETLIAKIIAHEGIHMWFGDLVSPAAWKYLWLNEAFATYFTYVIPHHYYPEWGVWEQFFHERLLSGMERDSLASTIAIDLPNADDPNADPAPTPSTAPIVYNKGAAVIRMLAAYLGEDTFRQALHDFLTEYQFEFASSAQFWAAVETSSGVPTQNFSKTWIHQPGHPIITVELSDDNLSLNQRRFCYAAVESENTWVIPVDLLLFLDDGTIQSRQVIFETENLAVEIPENTLAYKLNAGFTGFYRANYPDKNWHQLGERIKDQSLDAVDSLNVIDDFFALVKVGLHSVTDYLGFVEDYCGDEDRYLPLTNLAKNLGLLYKTNLGQREKISAIGLPIFERSLDQMGWTPKDDEPLVITELRETLLWAAFCLNSTHIADFIDSEYRRYLKGQPVHKDIIGTVLKIGAAIHPDAYDYLWSIASDPERTEAERIMTLEALGNHPDRVILLGLLERNLTETPASLQSYLIQAVAQSRLGSNFMWDWFCNKLPELETRPLHVVERLIVGIIPLSGLGRTDEVTQILDDFADRHPNAVDSVKMALELMAINQRLHDSETPGDAKP